MAIGAHADDIEVCAGGTLIKYMELGYDVVYVMSTNNMSGRWNWLLPDGTRTGRLPPYHELQPQRKKESAEAAKYFGTEAIHLDHPQRHYTRKDGTAAEIAYGSDKPECVADNRPTILTAYEHAGYVTEVADLILKHQPEAVLTHGPIQVNIEHTGTCLLVSKAFRQAAKAGHDGMLLHWLDVTPDAPGAWFGRTFLRWDTFVNVSDYWDEKLESIKIHACQIPAPQNIEYPEWGPACGCRHAETFTVADWGRQPAYGSQLAYELLGNARCQ